jgi:hypothetical protein
MLEDLIGKGLLSSVSTLEAREECFEVLNRAREFCCGGRANEFADFRYARTFDEQKCEIPKRRLPHTGPKMVEMQSEARVQDEAKLRPLLDRPN